MTTLTRNVRRKTDATYRGREIVFEASPRVFYVREARRREMLAVPYDAILHLAYKIKARSEAAEKAAKRKAKR